MSRENLRIPSQACFAPRTSGNGRYFEVFCRRRQKGVNGVKASPPLIYISKRQSRELAYVNGVRGCLSWRWKEFRNLSANKPVLRAATTRADELFGRLNPLSQGLIVCQENFNFKSCLRDIWIMQKLRVFTWQFFAFLFSSIILAIKYLKFNNLLKVLNYYRGE